MNTPIESTAPGADSPAEASGSIGLTVEFESSLCHLHYAAVAVRTWSELTETFRPSAWKIELAVMEALTNIVVHAYEGRHDQWITIAWRADADRLVIQIRDRGKQMLEIPEGDFPVADAEGGRGWPIIRACVDRVSYRHERGVNQLSLEMLVPAR